MDKNDLTNQVKPDINIDLDQLKQQEARKKEELSTQSTVSLADLIKNTDILTVEDLKARWLRHILGEPRFIVEYSLFGGKMLIKLRSRTVREQDLILAQLNVDIKSGTLDPLSGQDVTGLFYMVRANKYGLAVSLVSCRTSDSNVVIYSDKTDEMLKDSNCIIPGSPIIAVYKNVVEPLSQPILNAFLDAYMSFELLQKTLLEESLKPDFWNPVAG